MNNVLINAKTFYGAECRVSFNKFAAGDSPSRSLQNLITNFKIRNSALRAVHT